MNKIDIDIDYIMELYYSNEYSIDPMCLLREATKAVICAKKRGKLDGMAVFKGNNEKAKRKLVKLNYLLGIGVDKILKELENGTD